jgi:signal transduction histidine kinase
MRLANETLCQATPNGLNASIHAMHRRAGQRMQRMITELLDFTGNRPESGLPLQLRSTDLAAIVAASLDEIRLLHPARSLELHSSPVGPCLGAWDPDRLVQLCGNLIGNAIEHSPPGSAVSIELTSDVTTAQLRISNTGNPIPPDILATLFHPFRRPSQRTRSNGGVGLGLHIVKQVVSAHSGSITVESDETATVFSVSLPRQLEAPTH